MSMVQMVGAEQMSAAASYLIRNWGEYGYSIGVEAAGWGKAAFLCRASDGSEFRFLVDRYGNVTDLPDAPSLDEALGRYSREREVRARLEGSAAS